MNLTYISKLPCNSVIYKSMYREYTNVYSLYKSISMSSVLVFLLTRIRYVYMFSHNTSRVHAQHYQSHNHNHVCSQMYNAPCTRTHKHVFFSVHYVQSTTHKHALQHTHNTLSNACSQHTWFVFVLLVQKQTVIKQQTNKRFGFVGP